MNKIFEFFNKILGLVVFIIAVFLVFAVFFHHHHHHGRWQHHKHFKGAGNKDSVVDAGRDSTNKR